MAGFVLACLPETRGVPLENMEALFDVWLKDTPLSEKMRLQGETRRPGQRENMRRVVEGRMWRWG